MALRWGQEMLCKAPLKSALPGAFLGLCVLLTVTGGFAVAEESGTIQDQTEKTPSSSTLLYYSDYFSFIGEDENGRVSFALDNNRGRDGNSWQAEHFVVLHADQEGQQGWIKVADNGSYKNEKHELQTIPNSAFFQFEGKPSEGITIHSPKNRLSLELEPIPFRLKRAYKGGQFLMGSAPGVLEWKDRTLKGRVIYEYLHMPDFNRLTRSYPGMWKDFHGLYATSQRYVSLACTSARRLDNEYQASRFRPKTVRTERHKQLGLGGFSMGIITGGLSAGERKKALYGLGELLI